jgi:hypothetical protein
MARASGRGDFEDAARSSGLRVRGQDGRIDHYPSRAVAAGDSCDHPCTINLADAVVDAVGEVEGAVGGEGEFLGGVEFGLQRVGGGAEAGEDGDGAVAVEAADDVMIGVGDEEVAVAIEGEAVGVDERTRRQWLVSGGTHGADVEASCAEEEDGI